MEHQRIINIPTCPTFEHFLRKSHLGKGFKLGYAFLRWTGLCYTYRLNDWDGRGSIYVEQITVCLAQPKTDQRSALGALGYSCGFDLSLLSRKPKEFPIKTPEVHFQGIHVFLCHLNLLKVLFKCLMWSVFFSHDHHQK